MRFRLPPAFHTSKTVRLHSYAFALLAAIGLVTTATSHVNMDLYLLDRYFVVTIGHLVFAAATLFGVFAVAWTVFQVLSRHAPHEPLGQTHFWLTFAGVLVSLIAVTVFSAGPRMGGPGVGQAYVVMFAMLFTVAVQLLFPAALVLSWFRREAA